MHVRMGPRSYGGGLIFVEVFAEHYTQVNSSPDEP